LKAECRVVLRLSVLVRVWEWGWLLRAEWHVVLKRGVREWQVVLCWAS